MKINKEYRLGGFFGNSQDKFEDKSGSGGGINMAFGRPGVFGKGKGRALRAEKRYLKRLARQGKLNEAGPQSQERLDYLRNVQKDRAKKIGAGYLGANLLAGAAILGGPAIAAKLAAKGAAKGAAAGAKKGLGKKIAQGLFKNRQALGNIFGGRRGGNTDTASEFSPEQQEQAMEGNFGQPDMYGEDGMRIYPGGGRLVGNQKRLDADGDGNISANDFALLRKERKGEEGVKIPEGATTRSLLLSLSDFLKEREKEAKSIDIPKSDRELLEMLLKRNHPREFQIAPPPRDQRFR